MPRFNTPENRKETYSSDRYWEQVANGGTEPTAEAWTYLEMLNSSKNNEGNSDKQNNDKSDE